MKIRGGWDVGGDYLPCAGHPVDMEVALRQVAVRGGHGHWSHRVIDNAMGKGWCAAKVIEDDAARALPGYIPVEGI